jgi:hypothetical protein
LSWQFGLAGASAAVLLASAATLAIDLRYVVRRVTPIPAWHFAGAPLLAATCIAALLLATRELSFPVRVLIAVGSWAGAVAIFRVLPRDELRFMLQLVRPTRDRSPGGS